MEWNGMQEYAIPAIANKISKGSTYIDNCKPAAAKLASTLIRSALDATATLRPLFLHCHQHHSKFQRNQMLKGKNEVEAFGIPVL